MNVSITLSYSEEQTFHKQTKNKTITQHREYNTYTLNTACSDLDSKAINVSPFMSMQVIEFAYRFQQHIKYFCRFFNKCIIECT